MEIEGRTVAGIGRGLCLLVGVEKGDTPGQAEALARKCAELRIFPDAAGKMNLGLAEASGEILAVSQFTLAGSVRKGRRPSFDNAEAPERAADLFAHFTACLRTAGFKVETGIFRAEMVVRIANDGPVTFVLECRPGGPVS